MGNPKAYPKAFTNNFLITSLTIILALWTLFIVIGFRKETQESSI